jgi:hypothetical protein
MSRDNEASCHSLLKSHMVEYRCTRPNPIQSNNLEVSSSQWTSPAEPFETRQRLEQLGQASSRAPFLALKTPRTTPPLLGRSTGPHANIGRPNPSGKRGVHHKQFLRPSTRPSPPSLITEGDPNTIERWGKLSGGTGADDPSSTGSYIHVDQGAECAALRISPASSRLTNHRLTLHKTTVRGCLPGVHTGSDHAVPRPAPPPTNQRNLHAQHAREETTAPYNFTYAVAVEMRMGKGRSNGAVARVASCVATQGCLHCILTITIG